MTVGGGTTTSYAISGLNTTLNGVSIGVSTESYIASAYATSSAALTIPSLTIDSDNHQTQLSSGHAFNASAVLSAQQAFDIQVIAVTFSSISCLSSLLAIYWFWLMRRNFRRDLVLLLILGDFWKSSEFLIMSASALVDRTIHTNSARCQATGFLLQSGTVSCDAAIFLISLHMSLQLFPPKRFRLGNDGLYRIRKWAYAAWAGYSTCTAALAFANGQPAYVYQGGLCTLPIRPFWFRLALSWIPRYLITIYIMSVAIRIYRLVGLEFKLYGPDTNRSTEASSHADPSTLSTVSSESTLPVDRPVNGDVSPATLRDDDVAPDDAAARRSSVVSTLTLTQRLSQTTEARAAGPLWPQTFGGQGSVMSDTLGLNLPDPDGRNPNMSRRTSRVQFADSFSNAEDASLSAPNSPSVRQDPRASHSPRPSHRSTIAESLATRSSDGRRTSISSNPAEMAAREAKRRKRKIQRQLRLLFVYPVTYVIMWIMPFVAHAMNYNDHFAQHPVFPISALNIFCQCFMGTCDVCIFSWREKPWRHIPGSAGTFLDSFVFWRHSLDPRRRRASSRASSAGSIGASTLGGQDDGASTRSPGRNAVRPATLGAWLCGWVWLPRRWSSNATASSKRTERSSQGSSRSRVSGDEGRPTASLVARRGYSGGSDSRVAAADMARKRLAMERMAAQQQQSQGQRGPLERLPSVMATLHENETPRGEGMSNDYVSASGSGTPPTRREWWDVPMDVEGEGEEEELDDDEFDDEDEDGQDSGGTGGLEKQVDDIEVQDFAEDNDEGDQKEEV